MFVCQYLLCCVCHTHNFEISSKPRTLQTSTVDLFVINLMDKMCRPPIVLEYSKRATAVFATPRDNSCPKDVKNNPHVSFYPSDVRSFSRSLYVVDRCEQVNSKYYLNTINSRMFLKKK